MVKVIGVRFKKAGKIYYFDPLNYSIEKDSAVIVETARGIEFGQCVVGIREISENEIIAPLKPVLRVANQNDINKHLQNRNKEKDAFTTCEKKILEHKLEMKLVDVEYTFDNSKVIFYFTADGRIDFRELVKDLALIFRTRIELRQIGVRDEAKMLGGVGICGRNLCCSTWLGDFNSVSIKMAKEQNLSLNPTKISGICGRLMCCLNYEQETYEEIRQRLPKVGSIVKTNQGKGEVISNNIIKEMVKVRINLVSEEIIENFSIKDVTLIRGEYESLLEPKGQKELKELIVPAEEMTDNTEKTDKPDMTNKSDKIDKPDTTEKPDKIDKPDTTEKPDKIDKPDKTDKPDMTDKPDKIEKPEKTDKEIYEELMKANAESKDENTAKDN